MGTRLFNKFSTCDLKVNLFLCGACIDKGNKMTMNVTGCTFKNNKWVVATGVHENIFFRC